MAGNEGFCSLCEGWGYLSRVVGRSHSFSKQRETEIPYILLLARYFDQRPCSNPTSPSLIVFLNVSVPLMVLSLSAKSDHCFLVFYNTLMVAVAVGLLFFFFIDMHLNDLMLAAFKVSSNLSMYLRTTGAAYELRPSVWGGNSLVWLGPWIVCPCLVYFENSQFSACFACLYLLSQISSGMQ